MISESPVGASPMDTKVILLCGGRGTRIREETEFRPKPLVDVGGRPLIWHLMKMFGAQDFQQFILCLGYKGDLIRDYILGYESHTRDCTVHLGGAKRIDYHTQHPEENYQVTLVDTGLDTMTGGRIKRVQGYTGDRSVIVTYGDGVADIDLRALLAFHRAHGRLATVTVVRPRSRFGIIEVDDGNAVKSFAEKPEIGAWVSAGFFVFEPGAFAYLDGDDCVLEGSPLERMALEGQLAAFRHDGFFFAMDTYREHLELNALWNGGSAPWKTWE